METEPSKPMSERLVSVSLGSLARVGADVLVIVTVTGVFFGPLWWFNVNAPMSSITLRVEKLENAQEDLVKQINIIDKNVAVILERSKQQTDGMESLRRYMEAERRPN